MSVSARQRRLAWFAWAAVCLIWGTTYLGMRVALDTMPPLLLGGLRWTVAGALLAAVLVMRGERLPPPSTWPRFAVFGFLLLGLGNGGVVVGEQWVSSGLTAVTIATTPFWMVGFEALMPGGERWTLGKALGLGVGFAGILLLVSPGLSPGHPIDRHFLLGILAIQIACAGWAVGTSWRKREPHGQSVAMAAAMEMLTGGLCLTLCGTVIGEWTRLSFTGTTLTAYVYLTLVGAIGGFVAFSYAAEHLPVATVSLYAYINTVIAVVLGAIVLGEPFGPRTILSMVVILTGVAIVRRERPATARAVVVADLGATLSGRATQRTD
ncbi:MAG: EamA family transporter [Acidobacteriota bacterium]|nr:EamA family transporter [Acidobacteriota bacterium]